MHSRHHASVKNSRLPDRSRARITGKLPWASVSLMPMLFLAGCGGGITRVEIDPPATRVCDSRNAAACGVLADQAISFKVWGQGKCDSVGLKLGDGSTRFSGPIDFGGVNNQPLVPWQVTYTYPANTWPGPKTVHAYSVSNCVGESRLPVNVLRRVGTETRSIFELGFGQPTPTACTEIPNTRPLRTNTRVIIRTNTNPNVKINFGCAFGGCIYDANGEVGSVAPAGFMFPGLVKYSLVFRVGTQVVQGGTSMSFTTTQGGPLEACVNDETTMLSDNTGAWGVSISVDESQAR